MDGPAVLRIGRSQSICQLGELFLSRIKEFVKFGVQGSGLYKAESEI